MTDDPARRPGMSIPSPEQAARCRAASDQIMALLVGSTVQEASSILCFCLEEVIGLLARHDQPKAARAVLSAVPAHVAAQPPGCHRWTHQITLADVAAPPPPGPDDRAQAAP